MVNESIKKRKKKIVGLVFELIGELRYEGKEKEKRRGNDEENENEQDEDKGGDRRGWNAR